MFRATVVSRFSDIKSNPITKKLIEKYSVDLVFLNRKHIGDSVVDTVKAILKDDAKQVMAVLKKAPFVKQLNYTIIDKKIILANIVVPATTNKIFFDFENCNCLLETAHIKNDEVIQTVLVQNKNCFENALKEYAQKNKVCSVTYSNLADMELTVKQYNILRQAYELGYFDFPKKIRLEELSRIVGVSKAAALETLKRAEKKVLTKYFVP